MLALCVLVDLYIRVYFKESTLDNKEESGLQKGEKLPGIDHSRVVFGGHCRICEIIYG